MRYRKRKGKRLEEYVAELFNHGWDLGDGFFRRAQASGTYRYEFMSDVIIAGANPNQIVIECKNQESWSFDDVVYMRGNPSRWLKDLNNRVKILKQKYPDHDFVAMLIMKRRYKDPILMISQTDLENSGFFIKQVNKDIKWLIITNMDKTKYHVYDIKDFVSMYKLNKNKLMNG